MALVAAVAVAVAALAAATAVEGFRLGALALAPGAYGLLLVPGVVAVAVGRRPPTLLTLVLPPALARRAGMLALGAVAVLLVARVRPAGLGGAVTTAGALAVAALSWWWPHPPALRAGVALSALALARPGAAPRDHVPALVLLGASTAVALVACTRLSARATPVLGATPPPPRPRRVAVDAAVVALALLLGAVLAARMNQPQPAGSRPGAEPRRSDPAPLDYRDLLDPNDAGAGRDGGDPDEVILRVGAERAGALRALTFDEWDGRRWRRSSPLAEDRSSRGFVPVPNEGFPFRGELSEQTIRIEASYAAVAVGTPRVLSYWAPGGAAVAADGTVRFLPALGEGAVYSAQTSWAPATPDQLRAAGVVPARGPAGPAGPVGGEGGTGDGPSAAARELARRLTAGAGSDYDRVRALADHLAARVAVDDDLGALAPGADPVDEVLFGAGRATPARLATTLAVLVRAVGLPSRVATGFLPGERPFFGGDFVVRARHAHAWVEVPFAGIGWQPFDPSDRIAAAEGQDSLWSRLRRAWARYWPALVLVVVVLVVLGARRLFLRRRRLAARPWAARFFARLVRLGAKRGRPRHPAETPAEYAAALARGVLADERLVEVGRVVTEAAWSGREPEPGTRRWAEQVLAEAAEATARGATRRRKAAAPR